MGGGKAKTEKTLQRKFKKPTSCQQSQQKNTHEKLKRGGEGGGVNELCF